MFFKIKIFLPRTPIAIGVRGFLFLIDMMIQIKNIFQAVKMDI
jgi:hypothetical protein